MNQLNPVFPRFNLPDGVTMEDPAARRIDIARRVAQTSDFWLFDTSGSYGTTNTSCPPCAYATGPATSPEQAVADAEFATHAKGDILHLLETISRCNSKIKSLHNSLDKYHLCRVEEMTIREPIKTATPKRKTLIKTKKPVAGKPKKKKKK